MLGCSLGNSPNFKHYCSAFGDVACSRYHGAVWPRLLQTRHELHVGETCSRIQKQTLPHGVAQQHPNMLCLQQTLLHSKAPAIGTKPVANATRTVKSCMAAVWALPLCGAGPRAGVGLQQT